MRFDLVANLVFTREKPFHSLAHGDLILTTPQGKPSCFFLQLNSLENPKCERVSVMTSFQFWESQMKFKSRPA